MSACGSTCLRYFLWCEKNLVTFPISHLLSFHVKGSVLERSPQDGRMSLATAMVSVCICQGPLHVYVCVCMCVFVLAC